MGKFTFNMARISACGGREAENSVRSLGESLGEEEMQEAEVGHDAHRKAEVRV